jgi:cell division septum initiation protein DivIVA
MSTPQEHIKKIQDKLLLLVDKYNGLQRENEKLKKSLHDLHTEAENLKEKNDQMSLQLNMMKVAETDDSKEAKLALEKKINEYIKEIDKCIAHLGDQH